MNKQENKVVLLEGISKKFGGIYALQNVNFDLDNEIHSIVGHNGAGKSTLVKILIGGLKPDEGTIYLKGKPVSFSSPRESLPKGIAMVWQELSNYPNMSITENMMMRRYIKNKSGMIDWKENNAKCQEYLKRLDINIDENKLMSTLPLSTQQLIEFAKALSFNPSVLILDEPTSALSYTEQKVLYEKVRLIRDQGVAVVYISHKLEEVIMLSDRVSVLRDGKKVFTSPAGDLTKADLIDAVVGDTSSKKTKKVISVASNIKVEEREKVMDVISLSKGNNIKDVSFALHKGELLGLTGVSGSGVDEIGQILFGIDNEYTGEILINGKPKSYSSPRKAVKANIGYVPKNRKEEGIIPNMSVGDNMVIARLDRIGKAGIINGRKKTGVISPVIEKTALRPANPNMSIVDFSGGNQQKGIIGRWICAESDIMIFNEPTRGVDIGAIAKIYELIREMAASGKSVIVISSEFEEIHAVLDRIIVFKKGSIVGEVKPAEVAWEKIFAMAI